MVFELLFADQSVFQALNPRQLRMMDKNLTDSTLENISKSMQLVLYNGNPQNIPHSLKLLHVYYILLTYKELWT